MAALERHKYPPSLTACVCLCVCANGGATEGVKRTAPGQKTALYYYYYYYYSFH